MRRPRISVVVISVAAVVGSAVTVLCVWARPRMMQAGVASE
jgi:hypothetical protein